VRETLVSITSRQPLSRSVSRSMSWSPSRRIASPSTTPRAARIESTPILMAVWKKSVRALPFRELARGKKHFRVRHGQVDVHGVHGCGRGGHRRAEWSWWSGSAGWCRS
jgi:hypothetical protein